MPDQTEKSIGDRINAYKLVKNRLLKVTYKHERSDTVVVTVIEKERQRKR